MLWKIMNLEINNVPANILFCFRPGSLHPSLPLLEPPNTKIMNTCHFYEFIRTTRAWCNLSYFIFNDS